MLTTIATILAGLIGAGLVFMGANGVTRPHTATGFGIPGARADDRALLPWLRVKGLREVAPGIFVFVLMLVATPSDLGWYMLVFAAIPAGDAVVVLRSGGPKAIAYGVHATTALVMLLAGIGLLIG